jgi:hypothetical protein
LYTMGRSIVVLEVEIVVRNVLGTPLESRSWCWSMLCLTLLPLTFDRREKKLVGEEMEMVLGVRRGDSFGVAILLYCAT